MTPAKKAPGLAAVLRDLAAARHIGLPPAFHPEPLAALAYSDEVALKHDALAAFWRRERLPGRPEPIVPAPVPRGYRTTTKRRVSFGANGLVFGFPGSQRSVRGLAPSLLDAPEHLAVYAFLLERIGLKPARHLAAVLNWIVVRGPASGLAVILNVRRLDAGVVRAAKQIAEDLQGVALGVRAGFLFLDPSESEYYLEARRPAGTLSFKRLFGPAWLEAEVAGARLRFPPTVFSQVNGPMLATLVESVRGLLTPLGGCALLDLYCGYGLFAMTAGREAERVLGIDADAGAIEAARGNAEHLACAERVRFLSGRIDGAFLARRVRPPAASEAVLLDPPRQGTARDVAAVVAARAPRRVVHICCSADEIPREVAAWAASGYRVERAVPLDLFAGTAGIETILLLTPAVSAPPRTNPDLDRSSSTKPRPRPARR